MSRPLTVIIVAWWQVRPWQRRGLEGVVVARPSGCVARHEVHCERVGQRVTVKSPFE